MFTVEFGLGALHMDHPPAVYTLCGSDLGADRGERLLCAGGSDSAGHHSSLALAEDGTAQVGKGYVHLSLLDTLSRETPTTALFKHTHVHIHL